MKSLAKIIFLVFVSFAVLIVGYFLFFIASFCVAMVGLDNSSKEELIENYLDKKSELLQLKQHFDSIVPTPYRVYIEYKSDDAIDLWVFEKVDTAESGNVKWFQQWNINLYDYSPQPLTAFDTGTYSPKTKSLQLIKEKLGWNEDTSREIKKYLDKADCISIQNGEPATIGDARSGMGKYSYKLFNQPIPDFLQKKWNDSCTYLYYNEKLVLEYGGGAFGSQCFPDK